MPPRGPKPTPTSIKVAEGNPGKRRLNQNEPRPTPLPPECPDWLDAEAKAEWGRIAPELDKARLLTRIDRAALAGYCQAWSRWRAAEAMLQKSPVLIKAPSGYPVTNPLLSVANRAMEQMKGFLVEFGMTPSSRSRIDTGTDQGDSEMDELCDGPAPAGKVVPMRSKR